MSKAALCAFFMVAWTGVALADPVIDAPASRTFGNVRVTGTASASRDVPIANTGDAALSITNLAISGTQFTFATAPTFPIAIAPGTSVDITITFDPGASNLQTETLTITSNDLATPMATTMLTGTGVNAVIAVTDVMFGTVTDNTTQTGDITVTNIGSPVDPFVVSSATISGSAWFKFDTNGAAACGGLTTCPVGITVGSTGQTVRVRCTPLSTDTLTMQMATVTFTSTADPGGDSVSLLTCVAGRPNIVATPSLAFGDVAVGQTSSAQTVTVQNTGNRDLTYTASKVGAFASRYTLGGNCHTACTVLPGNQQTFTVTFSPLAPAQQDITIALATNDPDSLTTNIAVTGRGIAGVLEVVPTTQPFGPVPQDTVVTANISLRNTGNQPVTGITAVSNNGAYSAVAATVPAMLAAGGNATVTIRFAPTAAQTGGAGTITFSGTWGSAVSTMAVLGVSGTGTTIGYTLSTNAINFGNFRYDLQPTRTFCITNTGMSPVTINSPITFVPSGGTASNEFVVAGIKKQATCGTGGSTVSLPQTLATTEVLEVTVRAQAANRVGALTGDLTITSNLPVNPNKTVALTANAITAMLTMDPGATVSFGNVDIQGTAPQITVHVKNTGAAPLDIGNFTRTPNAAFTFTLPGASTIPPAGEITFVVTYAPTVALASDETVTITHSIAGDISAPATGMIVLRGRPTDRDLQIVGGDPQFPDTFRNPGTLGPVRTVSIRNSGTAPLQISSVTSTVPDVWEVLDPDPIVIPPSATMDIRVRFEPTGPGRADARLLIVNDDDDDGPPITQKTTEIILAGNCVDRRVSFNPNTINVGYVEVGTTYTIPEGLVVRSMDDANTFTIARIAVDGSDAFAIPNSSAITLDRVTMERRFDVTFTPTAAGPITAKAQLFLDEDPIHQSEIELQGTAVFVDARGGGGCSTGSGSGIGALVIVLAALLRRRRVALAAVLVATTVHADDNVMLSVFEPTPQTSGDGFQLQSATIGVHGAWAFGAVYSYAREPLLHLASTGTEQSVITASSLIDLGVAVALLGKLELGATMPFYSQTGEALGNRDVEYTAPPADGTATGDLRVHAKFRLVNASLDGDGSFGLAGSLGVTVPTSTDGMLTGGDNPSARLLAIMSLVPGAFSNRLTLTANAGAVLRAAAAYKNLEQKSGALWGFGASIRVIDPLWLSGEMYGELSPSARETMDGSSTVLSPIEWLGGLRWMPNHRFTVSIAAGRGLTSAAGAPALRGVFALTFTPMAKPLRPIHAPEPLKPDVDSDGDGVFDRVDRCDDALEDIDQFEDEDGCPDLDNDKDGVPDTKDRCVMEPEDQDGFEDDDGCPDKDNDGDGILDAMDKCPADAEDKDGYLDTDGCPELDNDEDGILDAQDKCPAEKETINGNQDSDGCPDTGVPLVMVALDRLDLMEAIQFTKEKIKPASYNLLGQIGATLRARADIVRVRIGVHVAATTDGAKDQQLSDKRAQAIREWLVQYGIAETRLDVRGFGSAKGGDERVELIVMEKK
jgi:outer membrane protein OmpA-like peptidoglycan-associated protein